MSPEHSNQPEPVEVAEAAEPGVVGGDAAAAEDGGAALQLLLPQEVGVAALVLRVCARNGHFLEFAGLGRLGVQSCLFPVLFTLAKS